MRSLRNAINDKCRECIYDENSGCGNWRQQVSRCSSYTCPLWELRPVSENVMGHGAPPENRDAHRTWLSQLVAADRQQRGST